MEQPSSFSLFHNEKLDNLLLPIFDTVRKNNINSYYQFKRLPSGEMQNPQKISSNHTMELGNLTHQNRSDINTKNNYIFSNNRSIGTAATFSKDYQKKKTFLDQGKINKLPMDKDSIQKNIKQMAKTLYVQRNKNSLNKLAEENDPQKIQMENRMNATAYPTAYGTAYTNPNHVLNALKNGNSPRKTILHDKIRAASRMKKHLVEYIDFEEIEKLLYKKRNYVSRYEYFCQKIKNNTKKKNRHKEQISKQLEKDTGLLLKDVDQQKFNDPKLTIETAFKQKPKSKSYCKDFSPDIIKNYVTISASKNVTPRKKFWIRQASQTQKTDRLRKKNNQLNENGKQSRDNSLSEAVQGKSFQTISYSPKYRSHKYSSSFKHRQQQQSIEKQIHLIIEPSNHQEEQLINQVLEN